MSKARRNFPLLTSLAEWWRERLTIGGRAVFCTMLFCLPGMLTVDAPVVMLFAALCGLLVVVGVANFAFRPSLRCQLQTPDHAKASDPFEVQLRVTNSRIRWAFELQLETANLKQPWRVERFPAPIYMLGRGEERTLSVSVACDKRGRFQLPRFAAASGFPFHLFRRAKRITKPVEILVLPKYKPVEFAPGMWGKDMPSESTQVQGVTAGAYEFAGNRDYQPGVPVRRWDYASWARLGRPVVREFEDYPQPSVMLVLDTIREDSTSQKFEAAISLTAGLADALLADRYRIDNLMVGTKVFENAIGGAGHELLDVLEQLAVAKLSPGKVANQQPEPLRLPPPTQNGMQAIVVLSGWDEQRRDVITAIDQAGYRPYCVIVSDEGQQLPTGFNGATVSATQIEAGEVNLS